jgi:hypothetical protein
VDSSLFLFGDLKVRKSVRLPFDVSNIINSKLSYIKVISYAACRRGKTLTLHLNTKAEPKHSRTADQEVVPLHL